MKTGKRESERRDKFFKKRPAGMGGAWHVRTAAILCSCFLVALTFAGCGGHSVSADSSSGSQPWAPSGKDKATYFTISQAQMSHLQIVRASTEDIPNVLRLPGSVTFNSFATTPVITQVSGIAARVIVVPGENVRTGQPLLYVSSPQYAQMRTDYLKARDALWLAKQNYVRAKDLYAHHAIATRDLEQAQSAQEQAQADQNAAWQALKVLGFNDPQEVLAHPVSPEIPVLAPLSGEIVDRTVAPGEVVQGGSTQCFTISNTSTVWVLANVYQSALNYIHRGDRVVIQTDAYPMTFHGRISYIAPALDPTTRTLQVRIVTDNPGERLKKDMYVTVVVDAGMLRGALTVPVAAVLRNDENQPFVYVQVQPLQFAQRLVAIGDTPDGKTQILSGLKAGEPVVADGSLFVQFANSLQ